MKHLRPCEICAPRPQPGFTLVEMAIVLLIVSILLTAILVPLSLQMELRKYADTKKTMDQINEALVGFAVSNGRLPCPASPTLRDGIDATVGTELYSGGSCTSIVGVIPWVTLGVPETDEWGGRFKYRVTSQFADLPPTTLTLGSESPPCVPPATPGPSSFALCAWGDMKIQSRTTAKAVYDMTNLRLPAVFISHGKNGMGAFRSNGTQIATAPNTTDEYTNSLSTTTTFVSREITGASSGCSDSAGATPMCEFDDLVAFIPLTTLMNRMVAAGKLP